MDNWLFISMLIFLSSLWLCLHFSKSNSPHQNQISSPQSACRNAQTYHEVTIHNCSTAYENIFKLFIDVLIKVNFGSK